MVNESSKLAIFDTLNNFQLNKTKKQPTACHINPQSLFHYLLRKWLHSRNKIVYQLAQINHIYSDFTLCTFWRFMKLITITLNVKQPISIKWGSTLGKWVGPPL